MLARIVAGHATTRWLWLIAAGSFFVAGLVTGEVWFRWATEEELQPNVDGLSVDEALLSGLLAGIAGVVLARYLSDRGRRRAAPGVRH